MLKGKNAIITGANRGIGLAVVEMFAGNGADIWACARKQTDEFENKLKEIAQKNNVSIVPVYFDVTDENEVKRAVKIIGNEKKAIDILVNNAGVTTDGLFSMTSMDNIRASMEINFISQLLITQLVSRYMIRKKSGSIINIASVSGMDNEKGRIAYGSSKAAIIFASRTIAMELGEYGIRVNTVSPGFIDTDMWKSRNPDLKLKICEETPLHRQGQTAEIAKTILFLASDMSSYITGQNIVVDGGRQK